MEERSSALRMPDRAVWLPTLAILSAGLLAVVTSAALTGLAAWTPQPLSLDLLWLVLFLFVVPSLAEELIFRGILHPASLANDRKAKICAATALFVLWHPVQFWTGIGPEWNALFVTAPFLITVSILGVMLALIREVSGSVWPCVLAHWIVVCGWKLLAGGPF